MGSFSGHFLSGLCLLFFGGLSAERLLREMATGQGYPVVKEGGLTTVKLNHFFLYNNMFDLFVIAATICGLLIECPNILPISTHAPMHRAIPHLFLYSLHTFCAITNILQSFHYLPEKTSIYVFLVSYYFIGEIWYYHSLMQDGAEQRFHQLANKICIFVTLCSLTALFFPAQRIPSQLGLLLGVTMHGLWMWTIAFTLFDVQNLTSPEKTDVPEWHVFLYFVVDAGALLTLSAVYFIAWKLFAGGPSSPLPSSSFAAYALVEDGGGGRGVEMYEEHC